MKKQKIQKMKKIERYLITTLLEFELTKSHYYSPTVLPYNSLQANYSLQVIA